MTENFCREHGMFHEAETRSPDCVFEDGFGVELGDDDQPPDDVPGFKGTWAALDALAAHLNPNVVHPGSES